MRTKPLANFSRFYHIKCVSSFDSSGVVGNYAARHSNPSHITSQAKKLSPSEKHADHASQDWVGLGCMQKY